MSKRKNIDLDVLYKLYKYYGFSTTRLASLFNCSTKTIQRRLKGLGFDLLKANNRDEYGRIHSKDRKDLKPQDKANNGRYKGGISIYRTLAFSDYGFIEKCYHCPSTEDIIIHHIDHNRYNNSPSNLRPCCRSCHMKIEHPESIEKAQKARLLKLKEKKKDRLRKKIKDK